MILITGANGHLGSATIDFLLKNKTGADIAGLVRSEEKGAELKAKGVHIRIGDYNDPAAMKEALQGVDHLLLISSSSLENRIGQHKNVIKAASEAGVKQIFYTSIVKADQLLSPLSGDHYETEKILKTSGMPYTIHRHTFYTEFFPMYLGEALKTGEWYFPSDGKKQNFALRTEMAEALANALTEPEKHRSKTYEITSSAAYSLDEYAEVLSEAAGKEITYMDIPVADFKEQLKQAGLPDDVVGMSVMVADTFVNGGLDHTSNDLENLLGRKPKETPEFIKEFINKQ